MRPGVNPIVYLGVAVAILFMVCCAIGLVGAFVDVDPPTHQIPTPISTSKDEE